MDRFDLIDKALADALPGRQVAEIVPMLGGMSAELFRVQMVDGDLLTIRFPSAFIGTMFADPTQHEFDVLAAIHHAGLPVPRPLFRTPDLLAMTYLPGVATACPKEPSAFVAEFARTLAAIHRAPTSGLEFLPTTRRTYEEPAEPANDDLRETEVRRAARALVPADPGPYGLRHGDFWPGNVLWQDGDLTGVIDWENALLGPALADLAISRLDVRWILGRDAMLEFTTAYLDENPLPTEHLRYWDLRAALRPMSNLPDWAAPYAALGRPDITPDTLRDTLLTHIGELL